MKIEYDIRNITGKDKSLCVGDLIRFYGETKYKMIEGIERLNKSETTKGMVANILRKTMKNPAVELIMTNLEGIANEKFFYFTVDDFDPLVFDNGKTKCKIIIEMRDEYFLAKAIYDMMKPGFRKIDYEEHVKKEKEKWLKWFGKNLREYSQCYDYNVLKK